jgi:hypothetical protein
MGYPNQRFTLRNGALVILEHVPNRAMSDSTGAAIAP